MSLGLRLLIASTPLWIWVAFYIVARSNVVSPQRLSSLLRAACFLCMPVWGVAVVFDRVHLADGAMGVFWGVVGADWWIERRVRLQNESAAASLMSGNSRERA